MHNGNLQDSSMHSMDGGVKSGLGSGVEGSRYSSDGMQQQQGRRGVGAAGMLSPSRGEFGSIGNLEAVAEEQRRSGELRRSAEQQQQQQRQKQQQQGGVQPVGSSWMGGGGGPMPVLQSAARAKALGLMEDSEFVAHVLSAANMSGGMPLPDLEVRLGFRGRDLG